MATAVEFDFETKRERTIAMEEVRAAVGAGRDCWIDVDTSDRTEAERVLHDLNVDNLVIEEALGAAVAGRLDGYEECLHMTVSAVRLKDGKLLTSQVDVIVGEHFVVTLHKGAVVFIDQVRRRYSKDFQKFAKTLSFLLYEIWDHLIDSYIKVLREIQNEVESMRSEIFAEQDDAIFSRVADLTRELLTFRKIMLIAREALYELSVRRSAFVSEHSLPYLSNMAGTMARLGTDLAVERETLAETLNLYLGLVSYRTNTTVNRLTIFSMIFLPLTFLCGVYGMNFEHLPEFKWQWGYAYFWLLAVTVAGGLYVVMKRNRWI